MQSIEREKPFRWMLTRIKLLCKSYFHAGPASISLQKQTFVTVWKQDGTFDNIAAWKNMIGLKLNPKTGFMLTLSTTKRFYPMTASIYGLYKCTLSGDDESSDDYVFVNVSKKSGKANFGVQGNSQTRSEIYYEIFKCCSGVPSKPPYLKVVNCDSLLECDVEKARILKKSNSRPILPAPFNQTSDCAIGTLYGVTSIVICKDENNIDLSQQYFNLLKKPELLINTSHSKAIDSPKIPPNFNEPESISWNAKLDRKLVISIGRPERETNDVEAGVIHREYFLKRQYLHVESQLSTIESNKIVQVNGDIYDGEIIYFMCFGLYLFHGEGGYIRISWKNGTKTVLQDASYQLTIVDFSNIFFIDSYIVNPVFVLPISASEEMTLVECYQPAWNASNWDKMEMSLKIKASVEPAFSGSEEEIVYFKLHEEGCQITCQLSQGTPTPQAIQVMKDDKSLVVTDGDENLANATDSIIVSLDQEKIVVTIKFPSISYESHGVYQCLAENVKGEGVKTIRVIVVDKSNSFFIVFLMCIGMIAAVCFGLGVRLWVQRRYVTFFQIDNRNMGVK